jgi:hypothetical protein
MVNPAACPAWTLAWARCTVTHSVTGAWSGDAEAPAEADADEEGEADADAAGAGSGWHGALLAARAFWASPLVPQASSAATANPASVRLTRRMLISTARILAGG